MANQMKTCVIIGSAPMQDDMNIKQYIKQDTYVICADGGFDYALKRGVQPDLLIGDFDSVKSTIQPNIETIRLPVEKDDTDMIAAVKEGLRRGYDEFILLGALGGRFDHSIANLSTLAFIADQNAKAVLIDKDYEVFLLSGGKLTLTQMAGCTISVFPFGVPFCTVSYQGLQYPLYEQSIYANYPLGVSNKILEDTAEIILHNGSALIIVLCNQSNKKSSDT